jgi:hypothetical protein
MGVSHQKTELKRKDACAFVRVCVVPSSKKKSFYRKEQKRFVRRNELVYQVNRVLRCFVRKKLSDI